MLGSRGLSESFCFDLCSVKPEVIFSFCQSKPHYFHNRIGGIFTLRLTNSSLLERSVFQQFFLVSSQITESQTGLS